jgi:hypothetical protein
MRRLALPVLLVASLLLPARADALTIKDLIDLTRAGLGDDILLALIEVDRSVLPIDTQTLTQLKDAGVSERVILAVVRSGRTPPPAPPVIIEEPEPAPPPPPQVVVIEHREQIREVPVAVPVYVPVYSAYPRHRSVRGTAGVQVAPGTTVPTRIYPPGTQVPQTPHKAAEPVYWGFGGKLRPDAWKPAKSGG